MDIKRILVPIDFSEASLNALASVRDLGKRFGAKLLLLYVVEPIYVADPYLAASPDVLDAQWDMAKEEMTRIGADLKKQGQRVHTMVRGGVAAQVIVDTATSTGADLIVMGTHGRTGLTHMLIGSVAEKVLRTASCPVLTVRGAVTNPH
jgi:nucleotide-binding universal stress UspA family protein